MTVGKYLDLGSLGYVRRAEAFIVFIATADLISAGGYKQLTNNGTLPALTAFYYAAPPRLSINNKVNYIIAYSIEYTYFMNH